MRLSCMIPRAIAGPGRPHAFAVNLEDLFALLGAHARADVTTPAL